MGKTALIVIYNHRYDGNIETIESLYRGRFSSIYHLMPFYDGSRSNVIPVYGSAFFFQGHVAQGFRHFCSDEFSRYLFIADDLVLNPLISEESLAEHLGLAEGTCFLPGFISLHEQPADRYWPRVTEACFYSTGQPGIEGAQAEIPAYSEALMAFSRHGLAVEPLAFDQVWGRRNRFQDCLDTLTAYIRGLFRAGPVSAVPVPLNRRFPLWLYHLMKSNFKKKRYQLQYPLVGSYSDMFIVSSRAIERFSHYCGVFAATGLFAELAIPTALALAAGEIVTERNSKLKGRALWPDGYIRLNGDPELASGDFLELERYGCRLKSLLDNFPADYLYLHPVKLSRWNVDL